MLYRKFRADQLFTGNRMLDSNSVLVVRETGRIEAIIPVSEAGAGVEVLKGILCPGFINCHCHLELSHLKGQIPEKGGLINFLLAVIKQRDLAPELIEMAIADGEEEMIRNGIVAVGDICNTGNTLAQKKQGNLYYHNFIEATGFTEITAGERFKNSLDLFTLFIKGSGIPAKSNSIVPHAPYSVSKTLFGMISAFPPNRLLSIHNQESEEENTFFETAGGEFLQLYKSLGIDISGFLPTGKRSLENYLPFFQKNESLLLVHNVATKEADLRFATGLPKPGVQLFFCICPNANLHIGGQIPDLPLLVNNACRIVIGTDSLASNHSLSILEELKTIEACFPQLGLSTLLGWATLNGAEALGIGSSAGSFSPGKKPGILLLENTGYNMLGMDSLCKKMI
jgi:aminodeoxyfutalosine deaminase